MQSEHCRAAHLQKLDQGAPLDQFDKRQLRDERDKALNDLGHRVKAVLDCILRLFHEKLRPGREQRARVMLIGKREEGSDCA